MEGGLAELECAVHAYSAPTLPTGDRVDEELIGLRRLIDRLELRFSRLAAAHARSGTWKDEGYLSPYHWLRTVCNMATGQAMDRVHVGLDLEDLTQSAASVAEGEIGFIHLALIAETRAAITASGRPFDEAALLATATVNDVTRFRHACHHLRHAADPKGFELDQAAEVEESYLDFRLRADGGAWLKGALDREGAAALKAALGPLSRRNGEADTRTQDQRNAHALVELARHALDAETIPGRPHLQVTASFETLAGHLGAPAGELEFSPPISRATVERLACDCTLTRVLLDSDSMVVDVGRSRRIVNGSRTRALHARDRGCRFPGCDRPASWTNAHHLVHWAQGGTTDLANLVLLCHRHHWMVHEGGWQLVRGEEPNSLLAIPPVATFAAWSQPPEPALVASG